MEQVNITHRVVLLPHVLFFNTNGSAAAFGLLILKQIEKNSKGPCMNIATWQLAKWKKNVQGQTKHLCLAQKK